MVNDNIQKKVLSDVDDSLESIRKEIQKKYNLSASKSRDSVNYSIRRLMLAYPEEWLKE